MKIIGITGGMGAGKSHILRFMEDEYKAFVCQADVAARELQEPGEICYDEIVRLFGSDILLPDHRIDRVKLGQIAFADRNTLDRLNQIVHPRVKEKILRMIADKRRENTNLFVIEAALLLEDHYDEICDELWYIYTEPNVREARLMEQRGYSKVKIRTVFGRQASEEEFKARCNRIIDNSGEFEDTCMQVHKALQGESN